MIKNSLKRFIFLCVILYCSNTIIAQPGFEDDVEDTPIDGGIVLILVAGAIIGIQNPKFIRKIK